MTTVVPQDSTAGEAVTKRVVFIRHAKSASNKEVSPPAIPRDAPLAKKGVVEAAKLNEVFFKSTDSDKKPLLGVGSFVQRLQDKKIQIWTSPMTRAVQTAKEVFKDVLKNDNIAKRFVYVPEAREITRGPGGVGSSCEAVSKELGFEWHDDAWEKCFEDEDFILDPKRVELIHGRIIDAFTGRRNHKKLRVAGNDCDGATMIVGAGTAGAPDTIYVVGHACIIAYYLLNYCENIGSGEKVKFISPTVGAAGSPYSEKQLSTLGEEKLTALRARLAEWDLHDNFPNMLGESFEFPDIGNCECVTVDYEMSEDGDEVVALKLSSATQ